jgi:ribosomal protein S18 acetylase RimI-like enzyme
MEHISIEKVTPADINPLQTIGKQTFVQTFAQHNSEQNMIQYLNESFNQQKLSDEISQDGSEFYFAKTGGEVIGYLKINAGGSQTEIQASNALEIERIYVLQEYHGKKVGQLLYEWAIQIAGNRKVDYVWLGVWEHNAKAIRFYEKNGFVPFSKHVFRLGDDEQTDIMMKKNLQ